jgi:Domain of unknown function (DUF5666)
MEADMRRIVLAGSVLALVTWLAPQPVAAQAEKTARGTVTAIAGNTLSVKAGTSEMKFAVDAKTIVTAEGGSTANRAAAEKGTGPKLSELVKVGDAVEVSYHETGATLHAARVRRIPSVGAGGGGTSEARAAAKSETSNGTVESISGSALTITGTSGGGSTFKQTFTIDSKTVLVGEGVGTAAAKAGGKLSFTDQVTKGDRVAVTYRQVGNILHADEVRITLKAK